MQDIDTAEARRLMEELRDPALRLRHVNALIARGEAVTDRWDDGQLVIAILRMRRRASHVPTSSHAEIEAFAACTGNTHEGARIMIEADMRYGTHTFVRGNAPSADKASPQRIKELREAGHSPKPSFIKMKSGPDGMFRPSLSDVNDGSIEAAINEGQLKIDGSGYLVDTRERLTSGPNIGFGKRFVSDVDLALVLTREGSGTTRCDEATYKAILKANSWFINQRCSCTHGAFTRWNAVTPKDVSTKTGLTNKHLVDKSYGHRGLSAEQIGRSELLRPPKRIAPVDLATATFRPLEGDPLIGFVDGRIFRTYIDRIYLDLIGYRIRSV